MPGAADPLQTAGDRRRRLDLDDQIDSPHVDAQLQAGRCHQRRELAGLQGVFDVEPLLARDGAVMRAYQLLAGEVVEPCCQPFGEPAGVDEDQC